MGDFISVFGATGFIGSHFCRHLNRHTIAIDREWSIPQTPRIVDFVSTVHNYNVFDDPMIDIDTNLRHLVNVLMQCRIAKESLNWNIEFNFASSWFVYGKTDLPAKETSPCNPNGFYSSTKLCAEQLLRSYSETFGFNYRILRFSNVLGPGDRKVSAKRNALQFMIKCLVEGTPIRLYKGSSVRDYIHVDDLCRAIELIINLGGLNTIYNVGNGVPLVISDLVHYAANKLNAENLIQEVEVPDFHRTVQVNEMYLDTSKLKSLGYKPQYSIYQIIDELIEYYGRNQSK